ncbi:retrovirus-related pol polyprotein from transposon TNT 1-94 [Tanacetum coccineum]
MLPSTRRVSSTDASGSKSRSNTKNDRIQRPSSRSKKNKVEAQLKKSKFSLNKNNHVSDCNANIKNNSANVCLSCNECLFSANHDACVLKYLKDVHKRKKAKSVKQKENLNGNQQIVEIVLWYLDSSCFKHMTGHRDKLINFDSNFIGTVRFSNDHFAATMGYRDLQIGNIIISRVYYVEGLGYNLFSVGEFCDSDLEVAFRKHICFVCKLDGINLLSGSCGSNLYTISMDEMMKSSLICLLSKASKTKSWLWHRRLSHLNFGTINQLAKQGLVKGLPKLKYTKDHLCPACQLGKIKKEPHPHKPELSANEKLQMLHMGLYGPMRMGSINGKIYILVIVDDYSRFTWVKFLREKNQAPKIIIKFLKQALVSLKAIFRYLHTDNEAARTMLIFSKSLLFLWAEAVTTACYTQNRSLIHPRYNKTPYELLRDRKPELKYLHIFGALCYPTNDFEDIGKLQPKADIVIFIGPELQGLTYGHISLGLVQNQAASTLAKPPTKND